MTPISGRIGFDCAKWESGVTILQHPERDPEEKANAVACLRSYLDSHTDAPRKLLEFSTKIDFVPRDPPAEDFFKAMVDKAQTSELFLTTSYALKTTDQKVLTFLSTKLSNVVLTASTWNSVRAPQSACFFPNGGTGDCFSSGNLQNIFEVARKDETQGDAASAAALFRALALYSPNAVQSARHAAALLPTSQKIEFCKTLVVKGRGGQAEACLDVVPNDTPDKHTLSLQAMAQRTVPPTPDEVSPLASKQSRLREAIVRCKAKSAPLRWTDGLAVKTLEGDATPSSLYAALARSSTTDATRTCFLGFAAAKCIGELNGTGFCTDTETIAEYAAAVSRDTRMELIDYVLDERQGLNSTTATFSIARVQALLQLHVALANVLARNVSEAQGPRSMMRHTQQASILWKALHGNEPIPKGLLPEPPAPP